MLKILLRTAKLKKAQVAVHNKEQEVQKNNKKSERCVRKNTL